METFCHKTGPKRGGASRRKTAGWRHGVWEKTNQNQETGRERPINQNQDRCKTSRQHSSRGEKTVNHTMCRKGFGGTGQVHRGNSGKSHEVPKRNGGGFVESDEKEIW